MSTDLYLPILETSSNPEDSNPLKRGTVQASTMNPQTGVVLAAQECSFYAV
jgi:hypothetical protein